MQNEMNLVNTNLFFENKRIVVKYMKSICIAIFLLFFVLIWTTYGRVIYFWSVSQSGVFCITSGNGTGFFFFFAIISWLLFVSSENTKLNFRLIFTKSFSYSSLTVFYEYHSRVMLNLYFCTVFVLLLLSPL